jgi:hypothetical protein
MVKWHSDLLEKVNALVERHPEKPLLLEVDNTVN